MTPGQQQPMSTQQQMMFRDSPMQQGGQPMYGSPMSRPMPMNPPQPAMINQQGLQTHQMNQQQQQQLVGQYSTHPAGPSPGGYATLGGAYPSPSPVPAMSGPSPGYAQEPSPGYGNLPMSAQKLAGAGKK